MLSHFHHASLMKSATLAGVILGATLGLALGVGAFTFIYAKGGSYLTERSQGLHQLPYHAGPIRRLG